MHTCLSVNFLVLTLIFSKVVSTIHVDVEYQMENPCVKFPLNNAMFSSHNTQNTPSVNGDHSIS